MRSVWLTFSLATLLLGAAAKGQVFTVGEKSATADLDTRVQPTHVELPNAGLTERGRLDLVRNLVGEQGFAHHVLPLASILTLEANGGLKPGAEEYRRLVYQKGTAAAVGDRVAVTAFAVKGDALEVDLNGGPYLKHRILRHVSVMGSEPMMNDGAVATGTRVLLRFEGGVPEVTAAEVKALLAPLVDFGAKTGEVAYKDTLPAPVKDAIDAHEVKVGMSHRMVLAALGAPDSKVREEADGKRYEEWIYGHVPQTVQFVRFTGDRVKEVRIARQGQPIQIVSREELGDVLPGGPPTRQIALGDVISDPGKQAAPTLLKPGEAATQGPSQGKVLVPAGSSASSRNDHTVGDSETSSGHVPGPQ